MMGGKRTYSPIKNLFWSVIRLLRLRPYANGDTLLKQLLNIISANGDAPPAIAQVTRDAYRLGRNNEVKKGGITWLEWQPSKKNAQLVSLPMLPPLAQAIQAQTVVGETYLLNQSGKPFGSAETLRNSMQNWCKDAGLTGLSSHGIRKAAGHLMALHGATQYEIMAVHGHANANASSSEVYTKGVERQRLAERANSRLASIDW